MSSELLVSVVLFAVGTALVCTGLLLNEVSTQLEKHSNAVLQLLSVVSTLSPKFDKLEAHLKDQDTLHKVQIHDLQQVKTRLTWSKKREKKDLKQEKGRKHGRS